MSAPSPQPALHVGDYRLLRKIGEGGMGVVHLAQAPDGRRVALKVLRPHVIGDDEARERLAREVSSLRRIRSPRVAEIVDADPWGETPFVATRYIPGLSLHEHIAQRGPIEGEDLRWFAQGLAEAVIAVHTVGVLHRDIKPSNVLLEGRAPVLIDFGLARLTEDPRLTMTGWLLGTPGYLAPEILYGDDATTASDIHSWAATVVFAATGRPPFGRGPAVAIMDRVRRGDHDLSGVPGDVLPLLRSCLAPEPADRPGTAAMLSALRGNAARGRLGDDHTRPLSLLRNDDETTEVIPAVGTTVPDAPTAPHTHVSSQPRDPTRALTRTPVPAAHPAQRAPHVAPPPPRAQQPHPSRTSAPEAWRPLPAGSARFQRGSLLLGMLALVTTGFALAPYLSLLTITLVALLVRTVSWTTQSARDRTYRRGRNRWYDAPLTALTSPWYLLVATGGTVVLVLWSVALAVIVGLGYALFSGAVVPGLLLMGVVLAFSLWWGPGSRRLRVPTRRLVVRATRRTPVGWLAVSVLGTAVLLCVLGLLSNGVIWEPQPGAPWRPGTLLGEVAGFLR